MNHIYLQKEYQLVQKQIWKDHTHANPNNLPVPQGSRPALNSYIGTYQFKKDPKLGQYHGANVQSDHFNKLDDETKKNKKLQYLNKTI